MEWGILRSTFPNCGKAYCTFEHSKIGHSSSNFIIYTIMLHNKSVVFIFVPMNEGDFAPHNVASLRLTIPYARYVPSRLQTYTMKTQMNAQSYEHDVSIKKVGIETMIKTEPQGHSAENGKDRREKSKRLLRDDKNKNAYTKWYAKRKRTGLCTSEDNQFFLETEECIPPQMPTETLTLGDCVLHGASWPPSRRHRAQKPIFARCSQA